MSKKFLFWDIPLVENFQLSLIDEAFDSAESLPSVWLFMNAHAFNLMWDVPLYRKCYLQATRVFPDGIGMRIMCRIFCGRPSADLNGTDLFPEIARESERKKYRVYFLGAKKRRVGKFVEYTRKVYPRLNIAGFHHGYFSVSEQPSILDDIVAQQTDILFLALGMPYQEQFTFEHRDKLKGVKLIICIGGLFDYGKHGIPRAPKWVQKVELEWAWRILFEPLRLWRRYILGAFTLGINLIKLACCKPRS